MSHKLTRVKPHTPTSYLMMPYYCMARTIINSVGWVGGKFKDSGGALSSTPSLLLLSDLRNEQTGSLRKACLRASQYSTRSKLRHTTHVPYAYPARSGVEDRLTCIRMYKTR
jgi:hypothetical protein